MLVRVLRCLRIHMRERVCVFCVFFLLFCVCLCACLWLSFYFYYFSFCFLMCIYLEVVRSFPKSRICDITNLSRLDCKCVFSLPASLERTTLLQKQARPVSEWQRVSLLIYKTLKWSSVVARRSYILVFSLCICLAWRQREKFDTKVSYFSLRLMLEMSWDKSWTVRWFFCSSNVRPVYLSNMLLIPPFI